MTDLLGGAGQSELLIEPDNRSAMSLWYQRPYGVLELDPQGQPGEFRTSHWPGAGGNLGDAGDVNYLPAGVPFCPFEMTRGGAYIFAIVGVTRDAYGSPVGSVIVNIFRSSDNIFLATTTSDALGNFTITTPYYPDNHFLVFYKAGSPDIFATTANTLVGG